MSKLDIVFRNMELPNAKRLNARVQALYRVQANGSLPAPERW